VLENLFKKTFYADDPKKVIQEDVILRLMFELAVSDGSLDKEELVMLKERALEISKDHEKISSVIKQAISGAEKSTSLYPTVQIINVSYTEEQKKDLLGILWRLVAVDGIIDHSEERLYFKIAELIRVKRSHANQIKQENS
tara:strand:- start:561 stop:983 length:423 start_codon:yes stop_codon:yes gene_type:complete